MTSGTNEQELVGQIGFLFLVGGPPNSTTACNSPLFTGPVDHLDRSAPVDAEE